MYYYTGYIPIRVGEEKLISFNCKNPIVYHLPKLVYEDLMKFEEPLGDRNRRLLNIFTVENMIDNPTFSSLKLTSLSYSEIQTCFTEDTMITKILLTHWLMRNYKKASSLKEPLNIIHNWNLENWNDMETEGFILPRETPRTIINTYILDVMAPTITPIINSQSFYNDFELLSNNTYQKYIFEGKYKKKWAKHRLAIPEG